MNIKQIKNINKIFPTKMPSFILENEIQKYISFSINYYFLLFFLFNTSITPTNTSIDATIIAIVALYPV